MLKHTLPRLLGTLIVLVPLSPSEVNAVTIRVGLPSDPACTSFSIPGAIANLPPGTTVHRILLSSNQTYQTAGTIDARNVSIEGGYANCSAAAPTAGAKTRIGPFPTASARLLTVQNSSAGSTVFEVTLRNLEVTGPAPAGALLARGGVDLVVVDTIVKEAGSMSLDAGGGVRNEQGAIVIVRGGSEILDNRAQTGGGVFCSGDGQVEIQSSDMLIAGNVAEFGGGVALAERCNLLWDPDTASTQGGINGNRAVLGGGIFADNAAIRWAGTGNLPFGPRRVIANLAEFNGGGIYLERGSVLDVPNIDVVSNAAGVIGGPASQGNCGGLSVNLSIARLARFRIEGNVALRDGGGVCLQRGEFLATAVNCTTGDCLNSAFNRASRQGGAFALGDASTLVLNEARIVGNTAPFDAAIHAEDSDASTARTAVRLRNALVFGNSASTNNLMGFRNTDFRLLSSTIADNASGLATIIDLGGSTIRLTASLLVDPVTSVLAAPLGTSLTTNCLIAQENVSLLPHGGNAVVTPPGFVNPAAGNYRLSSQSNALDRCADVNGDLPLLDITGSKRPIDLPLPNVAGPWDVGAYETQAGGQGPDLIFANGFE